MGGEGSGRHADPVKSLLGFGQPAPTDNAVVYLPNYSGIKDSARKDFTSPWTPGSVVFIGATGDFTQDSTNFFWDDTNNRLGIGTTSPSTPLHVSTTNAEVARFERTGGANSLIRLYSSASVYAQIAGLTTNALQMGPFGNTDVFNIISNGNVGIGTTAPRELLHVMGGIMTSGSITNGAPNSSTFSQYQGGGNIWCYGADTSTFSNFKILLTKSDGTGSKYPIVCTSGGVVQFSDNVVSIDGTNGIQIAAMSAPTLSLSGGIFVSGGECWYKGYAGTQTRLAVA